MQSSLIHIERFKTLNIIFRNFWWKDYVYMGGYNDNPNAGVVKKTWKHGEDVAAVDWEKYPWTEQKAISNKGDYRVEWQNEGNGIQIWFFNKDQGQGVSFK